MNIEDIPNAAVEAAFDAIGHEPVDPEQMKSAIASAVRILKPFGPYRFRAWCEECQSEIGANQTSVMRGWIKAHSTNHQPAPPDGAFSYSEENMPPTYPAKLADVVTELLDHGWSFMLQHGTDTGEHPFISVEAKKAKDGETVRITWHTRATGTYRLFSCMVNKRDVTLTRAREVIAA